MTTAHDTGRLEALTEQVFGDFAAAMTLPLVVLGDRLGLYRTMRDAGRVTAGELAEPLGLPEPIVAEWLANQAAAGYVDFVDDSYELSPEQALLFADETSTSCMLGAFQLAAAYTRGEPSFAQRLRDDVPCTWGDHDDELFHGVERFYRPAYTVSLVDQWIPALDGVEAQLRSGAHVADVGCGHGLSTVLMAEAFPRSTFVAIDSHQPSIARAAKLAADAGVADRIDFRTAEATALEGQFDFVTVLDAFHDMGNPPGVAAAIHDALVDGGACMIVEPMAGDSVAENLTPLGRIYYAASTLACTPSALSQHQGQPLGAQAGEQRLNAALRAGGFTQIRRAAETPFNIVLEARP